MGTALCLLMALFLANGCRKPAPPPLVDGIVRLETLTAMHPDQPMVADLDHRLQAIRAQREHLSVPTQAAVPPATMTLVTPAQPALPEPKPSPALDRNTEQFLMQRLDAYAQLLDRDRARQVNLALRQQQRRILAEQATARVAPTREAERQRRAIQQEYYLALLNTRMALETAESRMTRRSSAAQQKEWEAAQQEYQAVQQAYRTRLAEVDKKLLETIRAAETAVQQRYDAELDAYDRQLRNAHAQLLAQKRNELAVEDDREGATLVAPDMPSHPLPAGTLRLDIPGLKEQVQQGEAQQAQARHATLAQLDPDMAALQRECSTLLARIERDTRDAVTAVALQHGYRVHFTSGSAPDITGDVRAWLAEYWPR